MYAEIIIETAHPDVDKIFSYKIPESIVDLQVGMRVKVPFGVKNKKIEGYVVGLSQTSSIPKDKIKYIYEKCDNYSVFTPEMIILAKYMKEKYYCTLTECLQCIMPSGMNTKLTKKVKYAECVDLDKAQKFYNEIFQSKKTASQAEVLKLLMEKGKESTSNIKNSLKITQSPIDTLEKKGIIRLTENEEEKKFYNFKKIPRSIPMLPTKEQAYIIKTINEDMKKEEANTYLIHGITGSGKTEVYLQLIQNVLDMGRQAIVLVPEISLTPQILERFSARFGEKIAVTHSKMSLGERKEQWNRARTGEASIMIGPRSAVFAPFEKLGMIIIDEEHENSYKSESNPKYHAREVAQKRCELNRAKLVLGSATPSVETYYNAVSGQIKLFTMKNRAKSSNLPQVNIVDMRQELAQGNKSMFSNILYNEINTNLKNKEQTILFLNRRGHSTFVSCRKCGYVAKCSSCNVPYTYHQDKNKLVCHYCGKEISVPELCPVCGSKYIRYFGIGTQKVEEEVKKLFPQARVLRMDMDTTSGKNNHEKILEQFAKGEADILIGTQMIAKGHDFPKVTLVGVIAADTSLNMNDFRGGEITFQLLTQVAGRAGRAELAGRVYIQTYNPESYAVVCAKAQDYEEFYNQEILLRKILKYPPYSEISIFLFVGDNESEVINSSNMFMNILKFYNRKGNFELLGPVPANISKIKNQYRWKIIIKSTNEELLKKYIDYCTDKYKKVYAQGKVGISLYTNPMVSI